MDHQYELLGLTLSGKPSLKEARRAYRQKARECHPDKVSDDQKKEAELRFNQLKNALTDVEKHISSGYKSDILNIGNNSKYANNGPGDRYSQRFNDDIGVNETKDATGPVFHRDGHISRNSEKPMGNHWVKPKTQQSNTSFNIDDVFASDTSDSDEEEYYSESMYRSQQEILAAVNLSDKKNKNNNSKFSNSKSNMKNSINSKFDKLRKSATSAEPTATTDHNESKVSKSEIWTIKKNKEPSRLSLIGKKTSISIAKVKKSVTSSCSIM